MHPHRLPYNYVLRPASRWRVFAQTVPFSVPCMDRIKTCKHEVAVAPSGGDCGASPSCEHKTIGSTSSERAAPCACFQGHDKRNSTKRGDYERRSRVSKATASIAWLVARRAYTMLMREYSYGVWGGCCVFVWTLEPKWDYFMRRKHTHNQKTLCDNVDDDTTTTTMATAP